MVKKMMMAMVVLMMAVSANAQSKQFKAFGKTTTNLVNVVITMDNEVYEFMCLVRDAIDDSTVNKDEFGIITLKIKKLKEMNKKYIKVKDKNVKAHGKLTDEDKGNDLYYSTLGRAIWAMNINETNRENFDIAYDTLVAFME